MYFCIRLENMIMSDTLTEKKEERKTQLEENYSLILWNDDVNDFDDVIDALVEVCGHDYLQAEQCATIAHHKGKCNVKTDEPIDKLKRMKREFDRRLINTSIE